MAKHLNNPEGYIHTDETAFLKNRHMKANVRKVINVINQFV